MSERDIQEVEQKASHVFEEQRTRDQIKRYYTRQQQSKNTRRDRDGEGGGNASGGVRAGAGRKRKQGVLPVEMDLSMGNKSIGILSAKEVKPTSHTNVSDGTGSHATSSSSTSTNSGKQESLAVIRDDLPPADTSYDIGLDLSKCVKCYNTVSFSFDDEYNCCGSLCGDCVVRYSTLFGKDSNHQGCLASWLLDQKCRNPDRLVRNNPENKNKNENVFVFDPYDCSDSKLSSFYSDDSFSNLSVVPPPFSPSNLHSPILIPSDSSSSSSHPTCPFQSSFSSTSVCVVCKSVH